MGGRVYRSGRQRRQAQRITRASGLGLRYVRSEADHENARKAQFSQRWTVEGVATISFRLHTKTGRGQCWLNERSKRNRERRTKRNANAKRRHKKQERKASEARAVRRNRTHRRRRKAHCELEREAPSNAEGGGPKDIPTAHLQTRGPKRLGGQGPLPRPQRCLDSRRSWTMHAC